MKRIKVLISIFITMLVVFTVSPMVEAADSIDEVRYLLDNYYVDELDSSVLEKPTIQEMTDELDPYSVYMTAEEYERFTNSINQELVGIGIVLIEHEQGIEVVQTIPGSPAEQMGLVAGDIITKVDGRELKGEPTQTAVSLISGKEGTDVTITFIQKATGNLVTRTIERERISLPAVDATMLGGNIGYIRLYSFSMNAAEKIQEAIQSLHGAKGFILDLRDNGGGYVSAAKEVAGLFPNVTTTFQLRKRDGVAQVYQAIKQNVQFTAPVHILINENSASASEMVSAAVKEQAGARLYGQPSYRKGSMQSMFTLNDGSVLKLTTAKFYSPNGTAINGVGVQPNVEIGKGKELSTSHWYQLIGIYSDYREFPALKDVPTDKTFSIKMNTKMNWDSVEVNDVQLIQLGGEAVDVTIKAVDKRTLKVIPNQPLTLGAEYILIIHPNWKSASNIGMKRGSYLKVVVRGDR